MNGSGEAGMLKPLSSLCPVPAPAPGNTAERLLCHGALGPKSYSELIPFFTPSSRPGPGSQKHSAPSLQTPLPALHPVEAGWNLDSHSHSSGSDSFPPGFPASLGWYVEHPWLWGSKAIQGLTLGFIKIWRIFCVIG